MAVVASTLPSRIDCGEVSRGIGTPRGGVDGDIAIFSRALRKRDVGALVQPWQSDGGDVVAADCRLDEPGEIAAALGFDTHRRHDDVQLVAAACQRWQVGAAARLNSASSAFAHWEERSQRLILARDGLGTRPLFYVDHPRGLFFASTMQSLLSLPEVSREIDELVLAQYLTLEPKDHQRTLYRQTPPGATRRLRRGGSHRGARVALLDAK